MEKLFVPYEIAVNLKLKGFDSECFGHYENENKLLVINFNNLPLTAEQSKRPSLYTISHKNSILPQWATSAPTYEQCVNFFREKHNIEISSPVRKEKDLGIFYGGYIKKYDDSFGKSYGSNFRDYYEAYNQGIEEALKLI
jgi:hypothetical protein